MKTVSMCYLRPLNPFSRTVSIRNFLVKMSMEESLNLRLKAREILVSPSHEGVEMIVEQLSKGAISQETNEFKTASAMYYFCVVNFPSCLIMKLLKVYRCSSNDELRYRSIHFLSTTLARLRTQNLELSPVALHEIKPLVISCLKMEETKVSDMKILRKIVSVIVYNVVTCDNDGWQELSDCILWLANKEPLKAFHVFIDLPSVYGKFINQFMNLLVDEAVKVLLKPEESGVEDWSLALETVVKVGIQLLDAEMRLDLINHLLDILEKSVKYLVGKRMEPFLLRGLDHLERFLSRDKDACNYSKEQCGFVKSLMFKIKDFGTQTKEIVKKIYQLVRTQDSPTGKLSPSVLEPQENQDDEAQHDHDWYDHLKTLSPVNIVTILVWDVHGVRFREIAIRRLEVLLSDHTSKKVEIDISEMRQLQPLLISCLYNKEISDSMFKVLGEVLNHVLYEMFKHQEVTWYALRDYIASKSKTEFQRAVYIFQCLTMPLEDDEFVIHVMKNLLPEIGTRLNPPTELLVDNICWVLAFTGAFCATIHLIKITSHAKTVEEITHKMIDSVRELVEIRMEVGLVRRAFRDMESIVKKQVKWYGTSEYKSVKGLLWGLYAIKGMKWESKIVLWRVNVIVDRRERGC